MRDLGDKIASTLIAQSANVNCVPWNGTGVMVNYTEEGIPEAVYKRATVSTLEETIEAVRKIGYPVMIKASEGGGGKGIRKVVSADTLEAAFRQVQGEVPGSPIFIMKMVKQARHLEVQILAGLIWKKADRNSLYRSIWSRNRALRKRLFGSAKTPENHRRRPADHRAD